MPEHPALKLFTSALEKREVTEAKATEFDKWRNGPKCTGEIKTAADELWARYQADPDAAAAKRPRYQPPPPQRPTGSGPRGGRQEHHGNRGPAPGRAPDGRPGAESGGGRGFGQVGPRPGQRDEPGRGGGRPQQPQRADNAGAGDPAILGQPFHNPYTFLPFAATPPRRHPPTPLSIDEVERDRFTGVIDLEIQLLSPLLTAEPDAATEKGGHRTHEVLAIGDDVIVPATGIRGALRSLLSVLTGGTLGHVDEEAWLCQGRDANLGPEGPQTAGRVPKHECLAEVIRPGGLHRAGTVRLGTTRLVKLEVLQQAGESAGFSGFPRPQPGYEVEHLWSNEDGTELSSDESAATPWKVKFSGRPVNWDGKREGLFLRGEAILEIPSRHWLAFRGRHRHGDHVELHEGDLVWLEPNGLDVTISKSEHVKSIQWARWGREGERLLDVLRDFHSAVLPDAWNPDGKVDEVTDLFGLVSRDDLKKEFNPAAGESDKPARPFAARVRPGNLVFFEARTRAQLTTLAPLCPPHPGCAAFYRELTNPRDLGVSADEVANRKRALRGYKVYRTTQERKAREPWRYESQPVFGDDGLPGSPRQKVNKTCALLPETVPPGRLRITVRALTRRELALLLAACSVDWRLGGGKPLGLGHCRVSSVTIRELRDDGTLGAPATMLREDQRPAALPEPWAGEFKKDAQLVERVGLWQASQTPVEHLRYPRAVEQNQSKKSRGGHVWFLRHAQPCKTGREELHPVGLQTLHLHPEGDLAVRAQKPRLRAQPLPPFDPARPTEDILHGYDLHVGQGEDWLVKSKGQKLYKKLEPFDPQRHGRAGDRSGGPRGQSRETRQGDRERGRRR